MTQDLQYYVEFFRFTWPDATLRDLLELGIPRKQLLEWTKSKRGKCGRIPLNDKISLYDKAHR